MKKIALVLPEAGPVPAVKGGAIEELLTILVEQNEIEHRDRSGFTKKHCWYFVRTMSRRGRLQRSISIRKLYIFQRQHWQIV